MLFAARKGWLVPLECGLPRHMLRLLPKYVVWIGLFHASLSRASFCLRLLSSLFLLCPCMYAYFAGLTLSLTLAFYLRLGGVGPLQNLDISSCTQSVVAPSPTYLSR